MSRALVKKRSYSGKVIKMSVLWLSDNLKPNFPYITTEESSKTVRLRNTQHLGLQCNYILKQSQETYPKDVHLPHCYTTPASTIPGFLV